MASFSGSLHHQRARGGQALGLGHPKALYSCRFGATCAPALKLVMLAFL
jgi:hypothetical protein